MIKVVLTPKKDIKVALKPEQGIQIEATKKYLFDPTVVQEYVDASAENASKAEEQANRAEQVFTDVTVFVDNSKTEINGIIEQGKTEINTVIDNGRMEISDSILEATEEVKKAGSEAAKEAVQGAADEATRIATEQLNTYVVDVVSPQIQEFVNNAEADASNAAESAELAAKSANESAVYSTDSQHYSEDSRIWAEGEQAEVKPLGGELSSKGWALQAINSATSASQSAAQAKTSETNAKSYADSLNPSTLVKTSGDQKINGTKTFTSRHIIQSYASDIGGNGIKIQDSNNKGYVALYEYITSDGSHFARLLNNSYGKNAYIDIQTSSAGVRKINLKNTDSVEAPTPSAISNDTNIATTAFVNNAGAVVKSKSLADNGYVKFSSGLIIQWGRRTGNTGTVTLPTAFSSATSYSVGTTYNGSSETDHMYAVISDLTSTSFKMVAYNSSSICYWLAIGY